MLDLLEKHGALHKRLAADLAEVESRFSAELVSDLPCVNDLVLYIEQYRGKMLRPVLLLLTGYAVQPDGSLTDEHRTLATVVEMAHMATLVHDDVLDESDVRRNGQTVNCLRGNEAAVMLGDYLISHAYRLCSAMNDQAAACLIAQSTNTVCEGELLQLANRNNWSLDEQTYYEIIRRKTAALVGVSCRLGSIYCNAPRHICDAMEQFGQSVGTAFQIIDDVLDLTGNPEIVGKSLGKDLEKGKLTLPLIHRLETASPEDRQPIVDLLRSDSPNRAQRIGRILARSNSVAYARHRAAQLISHARNMLNVLEPSQARQTLEEIATAVIEREY